ncbi:hypothetical protein [Desulfovibrio sp.]|uniref:hypothetical protein n=1 Tax=Desulfovibrio sp. TaxID=885 RepID=UPI0025C66925|nr:hypothetical protein [Desulfovibrio sp.]
MNVNERIFALSPDLSGVWAITPEAMTAFVDALAGSLESTPQAMEQAAKAVADLAEQSQVLQGLIREMKNQG